MHGQYIDHAGRGPASEVPGRAITIPLASIRSHRSADDSSHSTGQYTDGGEYANDRH